MLSVQAKRLFTRVGTNVMTFDEPNKLVVEGVFRYTRNPMYLGFVISLLGLFLLLGANELSLGVVVLFVLVSDRWYIRFEERMMFEKFREQYQAYCRNVRRWM
ncbi:methyltransferase family protein [Pseudoalteromonas luteoviolacea]|nr:methyltransferase [Pseudoalteromonas luteoviolacea]